MKDALQYILDNILGVDVATVSEEDQDGFIVYRVSAPKDQIGKIIGKSGRTINSMKNLLKIRAIKEGKKIDIQIAEQE